MTLSKTQIDSLFIFVEKKQVHWYDLQTELVDHLANKIEEEIDANPSTNFETALQKVYASFGIFGFARIVREKEEQVRKHHRKLWFQEFKNQFVWPNLIRSIALLLSIIFLFNVLSKDYILLIGLAFVGINLIKKVIDQKKQSKRNKHLLLMQYYHLPSFVGTLYFQLFINTYSFDNFGTLTTNTNYVLIAIVFIITISLIASLKVASNIYNKAKQLYPEAFIVVK